MKNILIIVFYFVSSVTSAQQWIKTYGPGYEANWIIEHYDRGNIILGTKTINQRYGWIIKTDINGTILWNKHIGNGNCIMSLNNVEKTFDNGLIISGTTTKYGNQQDAFIIKLNSCGDLVWCSDVYTPSISDDIGLRIKPTLDGGYILLGSYNDVNPNLRTNLFKFDNLGQLLWHQAFLPDSAAFFDDGSDVLIDSTGFFITASCFYPNPGQSGGIERFYFIKTDTLGIKKWSMVYGGLTYYYGYPYNNSLVSNSGNYYSFGRHDVVATGVALPSVVKVSKNGDQSYNKDLLTNITLGAATAGTWMSDTTMIVSSGYVISMYYSAIELQKIDTLGNVLQSETMPPLSNVVVKISKTFDCKFLTIATNSQPSITNIVVYKVNSDLQYDSIYTQPFTYDSLCSHPIVSDTIDPDCGLIVNVEEPFTKPETHKLNIFPNPSKEMLTVVFPKYLMLENNTGPVKSVTTYHQWKSTILEAYDMNGKRFLIRDIPQDQARLELNVSSWPKGIYMFRLSYKNTLVTSEKVIVN